MPRSLAALVDLNGPGRYIHWGIIQLSLANLLVIGTMLVVFVLALLLPFPRERAVTRHRVSEPEAAAVDEHQVGRSER